MNFSFQPTNNKKPRITSRHARTPRNCAAPIARMVKHIEPWFDARFIDDSYANLKVKAYLRYAYLRYALDKIPAIAILKI